MTFDDRDGQCPQESGPLGVAALIADRSANGSAFA